MKDSWNFISSLKEGDHHPSMFFATLDVVDLFSYIPHDEGLVAFEEELFLSRMFDNNIVNTLVTLMELDLQNNYFLFNKDLFRQVSGVAMGVPCTSVYANTYMYWWEKNTFSNPAFPYTLNSISGTWMIYFWHGPALSFFEYINQVNTFLKFTKTLAKDEIDYLDIKVYIRDNKVETTIYMKDTYWNSYLSFNSCHPTWQKKKKSW